MTDRMNSQEKDWQDVWIRQSTLTALPQEYLTGRQKSGQSLPILKNSVQTAGDDCAFGTEIRRSEVTGITFLNFPDIAPGNARDVSQAGDGSVQLWAEAGERGQKLFLTARNGVVFPEDSSFLFAGFCNLERIDFSSDVDTSLVRTMEGMFLGCSRLTRLELEGLDTRNVENMSGMFLNCEALTDLNLGSPDTGKLEDMSRMFRGCRSLRQLYAGGLDTRNVQDMSGLFQDCTGLVSLDLRRWDTSCVTDMSSMFSGCSSLAVLDLCPIRSDHVQDMREMFSGCCELSGLELGSFDAGGVRDMSGMFWSCVALRELELNCQNAENVADMADMFYLCSPDLKLITTSPAVCRQFVRDTL